MTSLDVIGADLHQRMLGAQIRTARRHLVANLESNNISNNEHLQSLMKIDQTLSSKYKYLPVVQILKENCQVATDLSKITSALGIIEKYSRNLLKPEDQRPKVWKMIKFGPMFQQRVDIMKGSKEVLKLLGYIVEIEDGLAFPEHTHPNMENIRQLTVEILLLQAEIVAYKQGIHPAKHNIDDVLPINARIAEKVFEENAKRSQPSLQSISNYKVDVSFPQESSVVKGEEKHSVPNTSFALPDTIQDVTEPTTPSVVSIQDSLLSAQIELCDICGEKPGIIRCGNEICVSKQLCLGCDEMWHRHPKRITHQRQKLTPANVNSAQKILPDPDASSPTDKVRLPAHGTPFPNIQTTTVNMTSTKQSVSPKDSTTSNIDKINKTLIEYDKEIETLEAKRNKIITLDDQFFERDDFNVLSKRIEKLKKDRDSLIQEKQRMIHSDALLQGALVSQLGHEEQSSTYSLLLENVKRPPDEYKPGQIAQLIPVRDSTSPLSENKVIEKHVVLSNDSQYGPCFMCVKTTDLSLKNCQHCTIQLKFKDGRSVAEESKDLIAGIKPKNEDVFVEDVGIKSKTLEHRLCGKWYCAHCTYVNEPDTRVCACCYRTTDDPKMFYDDRDGVGSQNTVDVTHCQGQASSKHEKEYAGSNKDSGANDIFVESQDQVYREKQQALALFRQQSQQESLTSIEKPSDSLSPTNQMASGEPHMFPTKEYKEKDVRTQIESKEKLSTEKELERISEQRRQEQLMFEGQETLRLLRLLDYNHHDVDVLDLALHHCDDEKPVDWIKEKMPQMVDSLVTMVTTKGIHENDNMVGVLSVEEAKSALVKLKDMDSACDYCIQERIKKYKMLAETCAYKKEEILRALSNNQGNEIKAQNMLNKERLAQFLERVWKQTGDGTIRESECTHAVTEEQFIAVVKDKDTDIERRIIMVLVEGNLVSWGRAETVIRILDMPSLDSEATIEDIIEAVRNGQGDLHNSLAYLQQLCTLCLCNFPMNKMRNLSLCECRMCAGCLQGYYEVQIRERLAKDMACPVCGRPDIINENQSEAENHFQFLELMLKNLVDEDTYQLFEKKLRDWHLMKDTNFRWCAHCEEGFIFNPEEPGRRKMECPNCKQFTCFQCKKPWEDQHTGLTCEQFQLWQQHNNSEYQAAGLARHLQENGIDCPNCNFRYALAKGGCMHFKCGQCSHEFCSGCSEPFKRENCGKYTKCATAGLHCHHPRNCLFYLRDNSVQDLQKLLTENGIEFDTQSTCENQTEDATKCCVMEQKETPNGLKDEPCAKHVPANYAGLCDVHYKEYLVGLSNNHNIDPVTLFNVDELKIILWRSEIVVPEKRRKQTAEIYHQMLIQVIKEKEPLTDISRPGQVESVCLP